MDPEYPTRIALAELDGRLVLYLGAGNAIGRFDVESGQAVGPVRPWPDEISALAPIRVDERDVLFVVDDYVMCKLDARTMEVLVGWIDRD